MRQREKAWRTWIAGAREQRWPSRGLAPGASLKRTLALNVSLNEYRTSCCVFREETHHFCGAEKGLEDTRGCSRPSANLGSLYVPGADTRQTRPATAWDQEYSTTMGWDRASQRRKSVWAPSKSNLSHRRRSLRTAVAFGGGWDVTLGSLLSTLLALGLVLWSERRTCSLCQGTGTAPCPVCKATGWEPSSRAQVCTNCEGVGRVPCPRCAGRSQRRRLRRRPGQQPARSGSADD